MKSIIPLEQEVQKAILTYLKNHPKVAWAARFNSGSAPLIGKNGRPRPVKFNNLKGCPDIFGQLTNGTLLAIEVKRPGWIKPKDDREFDQLTFLETVCANRGLGFFATSVAQVESRLLLFVA